MVSEVSSNLRFCDFMNRKLTDAGKARWSQDLQSIAGTVACTWPGEQWPLQSLRLVPADERSPAAPSEELVGRVGRPEAAAGSSGGLSPAQHFSSLFFGKWLCNSYLFVPLVNQRQERWGPPAWQWLMQEGCFGSPGLVDWCSGV